MTVNQEGLDRCQDLQPNLRVLMKKLLIILAVLPGCATDGPKIYACHRIYKPVVVTTESEDSAKNLTSLVETLGNIDYGHREFTYECEVLK